ncbi:MAG: tetratricopeptide repeat protein, partial [Planctomycetes bacterium]|nr:tetratricopeptide repeat protein [Planctomycetota bacterium]
DQVEIYSRRHLQARRQLTPSLQTGPVKRSNRKMRGDFEILETLGQHVDGITYRAIHEPSGAVVVTHFFNQGNGETGFEESEQREKLTSLRSPAIQMVFSSEEIGGQAVLAAEFIEGMTLAEVISSQTKIEWLWAVEILHDLTLALMEAGKLGLHHDDIRPGTILVDNSGRVKLGMWHYTRDPIANRDWLAKKHHPLSFYFAPERPAGQATIKSDMFSLGLTLVHALVGTPPVRGNNAADAASRYNAQEALGELAIDMDLPFRLVSMLSRMVEANPADRYDGFSQLYDELKMFMDDEGINLDTERNVFLESRSLNPEEARATLDRFLASELTVRTVKKVSITRLMKYYLGPVAAMIILTLAVTVLYKTTQASHGMMVRANYLDQQGDKAGALSLYRIISTLYPNDEQVQRRYFDLGMEMKDHGEAEIALERLLVLHPERRNEYLETQADLQVWQRRFLPAVDLYREVQITKPGDQMLKRKIANALLWAGNYTEAQDELAELLLIEPNDNELLLSLARAAAGSGDHETAIASFDRLFRRNLLPESSLMEYAWLLHDDGRDDELRTLAEIALARKDSADYSRLNQVNLHFWAGNYQEAARGLESLAAVNPNDKDFLLFRISINSKIGNIEAEIEDYKRLAELEPGNSQYLMTIGNLYQGQNDFVQADNYFREALAVDDENADIRRAIALNLSYMQDRTEAIRWFREALARNPNDHEAITGMIESLLWNEDYAEAKQYIERLYRENPNNRTNRFNMALVLTRLGQEAEAMPLVDALLDEDILTADEKDRLAINAMASNSNEIFLKLVGRLEGEDARINELRLMLARRMRGEGRHLTALPLYAAVLAATPNPDPKLLMEMAETANWAGRHDVATTWLELARDIVAAREQGRERQFVQGPDGARFRLTDEQWDSILVPLRAEPRVFDSVSGFKAMFGRAEVAAPSRPAQTPVDKYF